METLESAARWLEEQQPEPVVLFLRELVSRYDLVLQQSTLNAEEATKYMERAQGYQQEVHRLNDKLSEKTEENRQTYAEFNELKMGYDKLMGRFKQALLVVDGAKELCRLHAQWTRSEQVALERQDQARRPGA